MKNRIIFVKSGWESEGPEFEPWRLQATFDPMGY